MLGISLYPDKTTLEEDIAYLKLAKSYGYQRVFMSMLQIDVNNPKKSIQRLKESISYANQYDMPVTLDIHPIVFDYLKIEDYDLSYFHELGVDTIRLDSGFNGRIEAMMTHNPYGISIELNMSNDIKYLDLIHSYCPNRQYLKGSHNFYPQKYTGLSLQSFMNCSQRFLHYHIPSAAFINSQQAAISPWPVSEGQCTLEMHRDLPIEIQVRHLKMLHMVDDMIIGNAYASEDELRKAKEAYESQIDVLRMELFEDTTELETEMIFKYPHEYRGDASEYVIRSSKNRRRYQGIILEAHEQKREIHRGDILILNNKYGQYQAELQIALCDRAGDERINVVGEVCEEDMILLDLLRPFQTFRLERK